MSVPFPDDAIYSTCHADRAWVVDDWLVGLGIPRERYKDLLLIGQIALVVYNPPIRQLTGGEDLVYS